MSNFPKKKIRTKKINLPSKKRNSGVKPPSIFRGIFKKLFWNKKFFYLFLFLFIIFIPWVPVLYFGVLIYFPYDETGENRYLRITGPLIQYVGGDWVNTKQIPLYCKKGLVIAEDSEFYNHSGISFESIRSSFEYNRRRGRIISGASTISQQFIKNAFLNRKKTYIRKIREAFGAILFNFLFSKDQQLTWYLNVVEFGPQIYGIKAAANYYFKKDPANLDLKECVVLITFLPRPVQFGKAFKAGRISGAYQRRFQRIYSGLNPIPLKIEKKEVE